MKENIVKEEECKGEGNRDRIWRTKRRRIKGNRETSIG